MITRIEIDPNIRVRGNGTYAGFEDVDGPLAVGQSVEVYESEANIVGSGRVTEIDVEKRLVYMSVEWASLRDPADHPMQEEDRPSATLWPVFRQPPADLAVCLVTAPLWTAAIGTAIEWSGTVMWLPSESPEICVAVSS